MSKRNRPKKAPGTGKVAKELNKESPEASATPLNQGRRSPQSRNDRDTQVGSTNQSSTRKGGSPR
jgi:hypothetical protein